MRFSYRFFITSDNVCLLVVNTEVIFSQERLNNADNQTLLKSMYIRAVILCISWLFYVNL